jgi:hypothetical protein
VGRGAIGRHGCPSWKCTREHYDKSREIRTEIAVGRAGRYYPAWVVQLLFGGLANGASKVLKLAAVEALVSLVPFGGTMRFSIAPTLDAACLVSSEFVSGEVYYVERNAEGGANFTPIARFFAWRPVHVENFQPHWRVDCFVRVHEMSPEPKFVATSLAEGLLGEAICTEPLWVSWHQSEEIGGTNYGEAFDFE